MPGVALHFVLAERIVDQWRKPGGDPPFRLEDPAPLNAFFHGAIGPDLGYFPGGDRFLSELSHLVRTGELARTLVRSARTPVERAYAWGWLTHFIGDQKIHPLVGRGVGEVTTGSPEVFIDGVSDPVNHLRVEIGLDCWFAARHPTARGTRIGPAFDDQSIRFLQGAYASTYGVELPPEWFLRSHRSSGRRALQSLSTLWVIGALTADRAWRLNLPEVRDTLGRVLRHTSLPCISRGYLTPVDPGPWLVKAVDRAVKDHADTFMAFYRDGLDDLDDINLDTGRPIVEQPDHPGTVAAKTRLGGIELLDSTAAGRPAHDAFASRPSRHGRGVGDLPALDPLGA